MKNTLEATIGNTPLAQIKRLNDKKGGDIYPVSYTHLRAHET